MTDTDTGTNDANRSPLGFLAPALRRWPLLVLLAVAGGVLGFLGFSLSKPVYQSTTRIQVSKRYDSNAADGRMVYLEDYVATMTQIIASDAVLGEAARTLDAAQLTLPLPDDETARLDTLKASLSISRVRDPNAIATTSSSVLTLTYTSHDPGDAKTILDAVIRAVQKYLDRGYSEALVQQVAEVRTTLDRKVNERQALEQRLHEKKDELNRITIEELPLVRSRVTTNTNQAFTLELELIGVERDLKAIQDVGPSPAARQAKMRQLIGLARTPGEAAGPTGLESVLLQLNARRLELAERMGKDHPTMKELDGQIAFYRELIGRSTGAADTVDELALYEGRQRERKAALELQRDKIAAQVKHDEELLRKGAAVQDQAELLSRQLNEENLEINRQLDRQQALATAKESNRSYDARELDSPRVGYKIAPRLPTWVLPGLVLGLLLGVGLSYLAELADQSFRDPAEIRRRLGVPVFGHIPAIRLDQPATADVSAGYDAVLVTARRPKSVEAETFRGVRTQVLVATRAAGHRLIQVTSPNPGDGKSTTAANLAISLAQAGNRVILIDADFRKPRVHTLFAITKPELGLASVVDGTAELDAAVRPSDVDNLFVLPCGPRPANPAELLAGERFAAILGDLKAAYDHVVIDTPPLLAVSDPLVVAQRVDAVILVFGITRRSRVQVERAKELLTDTGANLIGVVVNGMDSPAAGYGTGYGTYKYAYNYEYTEQYTDDADTDPR